MKKFNIKEGRKKLSKMLSLSEWTFCHKSLRNFQMVAFITLQLKKYITNISALSHSESFNLYKFLSIST